MFTIGSTKAPVFRGSGGVLQGVAVPKAQTNGIEIAYEEQGEGEPLLLINGIGLQLVQWPDQFCEMLVERGFRVIRCDHRDVGLSTWLRDQRAPDPRLSVARRMMGRPIDAPYKLEDMADDMVGLLDALGIDAAHVTGMSMGGMIAQTMAIHHPERVQTLTSIMSTTGTIAHSYMTPRAMRVMFTPPPKDREGFIEFKVRFFRTTGGSGFAMDEKEIREHAAQAYDRAGPNISGFIRHMTAILSSGSREKALRSVRIPTMVIHGTEDPVVPPIGGRATARAIPDAELRMVRDMGHDLPPAILPTIVDDITRTALRAPLSTPSKAPRAAS